MVVVGSFLVVFALGLLAAGGAAMWADQTQRDAAGYVHFGTGQYRTGAYALSTQRLELDWHGISQIRPSTILGTVRIRVIPTSSTGAKGKLFVGIGPSSDVARYLAGVRYATVDDLGDTHISRVIPGGAPKSPPGHQDFWVDTAVGTGPQTLRWPIQSGAWRVVAMNASGRPGLALRADVGATIPALFWVGVGTLAGGGLFLALGLSLVITGALRATRRPR